MNNRLRELAPAARRSQDAGSRNLVFTFQLNTVMQNYENSSIIKQQAKVVLLVQHTYFILGVKVKAKAKGSLVSISEIELRGTMSEWEWESWRREVHTLTVYLRAESGSKPR